MNGSNKAFSGKSTSPGLLAWAIVFGKYSRGVQKLRCVGGGWVRFY